MLATRPSEDVRRFLSLRRSANKAMLGAPGPTPHQLDQILAAATRIPDHRRLSPWRFIVFEGDARAAFGDAAAKVHADEAEGVDESALQSTRQLMLRAPTIIAVVSSPKNDGKTPVWEQELSVGALGYNLLLAANAAGWGGVWLTEWVAFSDGINTLLGLAETERLAGFIYLGTPTANPQERARPAPSELIQRWSGH
ncbi:MAG: nitroreductase [Henriciella sp.]|uniref:nitroreductase family protein n=1 Tax=Henriciella sp. TaxID=1968823 RepID=UPI003C7563AA